MKRSTSIQQPNKLNKSRKVAKSSSKLDSNTTTVDTVKLILKTKAVAKKTEGSETCNAVGDFQLLAVEKPIRSICVISTSFLHKNLPKESRVTFILHLGNEERVPAKLKSHFHRLCHSREG